MAETGIEIHPFDPHTASAAAWRRYHAFRRIRSEKDEPGEPVLSDADFEHDLLRFWPMRESRRMLALAGGEIVGLIGFAFRREGTPDYESYARFLWSWGGVARTHRRRGVATALLGSLLAFMRERDKTLATFGTHLPEGRAFLEAIGAVEKMRSIENRMRFAGLDWDELATWEAGATGSGLRWEVHAGRVPLERLAMLLPRISELFRDVPMGTLERPPMRYKIQGYISWYENMERHGGEHLLVMLMDGDELVAMCEAGWDSRFPDRVSQTLTLVAREWRGRGLGKAVKAAMLRTLRQRHPEIAMMTTSNEVANAAMLSINDRLGFAQYRLDATYQIGRDGLERWVAGKA
jgi:RimJ/RimL family protein N-acetyltransferase